MSSNAPVTAAAIAIWFLWIRKSRYKIPLTIAELILYFRYVAKHPQVNVYGDSNRQQITVNPTQ